MPCEISEMRPMPCLLSLGGDSDWAKATHSSTACTEKRTTGNAATRCVTAPPKTERCSIRCLGLGDSDSVTNMGPDQESSPLLLQESGFNFRGPAAVESGIPPTSSGSSHFPLLCPLSSDCLLEEGQRMTLQRSSGRHFGTLCFPLPSLQT